MNEKNARQILTLAAISSVTGFVVAIVLALRGQQGTATLFLVLSRRQHRSLVPLQAIYPPA